MYLHIEEGKFEQEAQGYVKYTRRWTLFFFWNDFTFIVDKNLINTIVSKVHPAPIELYILQSIGRVTVVRAKLWTLFTNNWTYKLSEEFWDKFGLSQPEKAVDLGFFPAKVLRLRYGMFIF